MNEDLRPLPNFEVMSAQEIIEGVNEGVHSARKIVEEYIERIELVNPQLNAVVLPLFEQARATADALDAGQQGSEPSMPLYAVPITIKDQFMVAGVPTTWGLPSRARNKAAEDGPLVKRLREAGAIILGKTNVPELLFYYESDNPLFGRTNNPWNLQRTSGGSSGGEASILAAHGSVLGLGADIGGSIRIPAHFCGVHGLKPTTGRLTNLGSPPNLFPFGFDLIQAQPGIMAQTVSDIALAMNVLAAPGLEKIDPATAPVCWEDATRTEISLASLRIAMYTDDTFFPAAPAIRRAAREAGAFLREKGAVVEEWTPPEVPKAMQMCLNALSANGGTFVKHALGKNPVDFRLKGFLRITSLPNFLRPALAALLRLFGQPFAAFILLNTRPCSTNQYSQLAGECYQYRVRFLQALDKGGYDAIICPPHALPAFPHGRSLYLGISGSYSILYNLLGMPAGVVAATRVQPGEESDRKPGVDMIQRIAQSVEQGSAGLPVGVQVIGRYWREDIVLTIMNFLEHYFRTIKNYPLI